MGLATASLLASRGADVAILDLQDGTFKAQELLKQFRVRSKFFQCDVTVPEDVEHTVQGVIQWSGGRLDLAVNATGVLISDGYLHKVSPASFRRTMEVNVLGAFYALKEEISAFRRLRTKGSIVCITSDAGSYAVAGCVAYTTSKHALVGLVKSAALEYARDGIRVNAVAPGLIETPMMHALTDESMGSLGAKHPIDRVGPLEEVAELICFLLCDRARFMVGSNVAIDGGNTTAGFYRD